MYKFIKYVLDVIVALCTFIILLPVTIVTAIALAIIYKGTPFFLQRRPGKNERIFKIIKFKTMNNNKDANGNLLSDGERTTKIGLLIRKTSIDEIPQLINIIKGDMSFVGPRPLRVKYLPYYLPNERKRHSIRPGITGLAQVSGRNLLNWDDRLALDAKYVAEMSFLMDVKLLFKTVLKVMKSEDFIVDQAVVMKDLDEYRKGSKA